MSSAAPAAPPPPHTPPDIVLLEGPRARIRELGTVVRAGRDFIRGFRALHFVGPCVTIFGSARFKDDHPVYAQARAMVLIVGVGGGKQRVCVAAARQRAR